MSRKNDLYLLSEQYAKIYEGTDTIEPEGDASAVNMGPGGVLEVQPDGQYPEPPAKDENAEDSHDLDYAHRVITPEVTEYVLNLMAQKEGIPVDAYLAVAKEALGVANIDMSDEDLAEELVQRTLNSMSPENKDKIVSMAMAARK